MGRQMVEQERAKGHLRVVRFTAKVILGPLLALVLWTLVYNFTPAPQSGTVRKNLKNLEALDLAYTDMTDTGLMELKGLTNLKTLFLIATRVSDRGLKALKALTNLRTLWLTGADVTDAGLQELKGLTKLLVLDLSWTKVTGAGL